jgi:hypothetical protein
MRMLLDVKQRIERALFDQRVVIAGGGAVDWSQVLDAWIVAINCHHMGKADMRLFAAGSLGEYLKRPGVGADPERLFPAEDLAFALYEATIEPEHVEALVERFPWSARLPFFADLSYGRSSHGSIHEWTNTLFRRLDTRPLTGLIAVEFVRLLPVASYYVTGFDFYQTAGVIPYAIGSHVLAPQVEYLRELRKHDKRFSCDEQLARILDGKIKFQSVVTWMHGGQVFISPIDINKQERVEDAG